MVCENLQRGVFLKERGEALQLWKSSQAVFWLDVLKSSFPVDGEDEPETVALSLLLHISCSWQVFLPTWFSSPPGARLNKESKLQIHTNTLFLSYWYSFFMYKWGELLKQNKTEVMWGEGLRDVETAVKKYKSVETKKVWWLWIRPSAVLSGQLLFPMRLELSANPSPHSVAWRKINVELQSHLSLTHCC